MSFSDEQIYVPITSIVDQTLLSLRQISKNLDDLFAGHLAEMGMKHIFDKGADELLAIIHATPQAGYHVGQHLISLMEHKDPGVRALAAFFTGLAGIPFSLAAPHLQKGLLDDENLAVKIAATVHLQSRYEQDIPIPAHVRTLAQKFVITYLYLARQEPGSVHLPDNNFANSHGYGKKDLDKATAIGMMHMMQMLNHIPRIIALQGLDD